MQIIHLVLARHIFFQLMWHKNGRVILSWRMLQYLKACSDHRRYDEKQRTNDKNVQILMLQILFFRDIFLTVLSPGQGRFDPEQIKTAVTLQATSQLLIWSFFFRFLGWKFEIKTT